VERVSEVVKLIWPSCQVLQVPAVEVLKSVFHVDNLAATVAAKDIKGLQIEFSSES